MSKKLTDLIALTAPASGDFVHVVDISDTSQDSAGSSKKMTLASLLSFFGGGNWVMDYAPTEAVNGANTVFTVPNASQVVVHSDGLRVKGGGIDYTFSSNDTITFVSGGQPYASLSVDYLPM